jgi:hypothetical protein
MMSSKWLMFLIPVALLKAGDDTPPAQQPAWAAKQIAEWSEDDAKQVLADSPWVKSVTPSIIRGSQNQNQNGYPPGGMGRRGGIGMGIPGMGYPGGGYPGGGGGRRGGYPPANNGNDQSNDYPDQAPKLTLRWESALPVREAELKARDVNAPTLEDENHYAIAVYGIPASMLIGDTKQLAEECKKKTTLSRDNKKDMKPTSVQILRREDGPVVVIQFLRPKKKDKEEINKDDRRVEFDTQINRLSVTQSFYLEDMTFQGKIEL